MCRTSRGDSDCDKQLSDLSDRSPGPHMGRRSLQASVCHHLQRRWPWAPHARSSSAPNMALSGTMDDGAAEHRIIKEEEQRNLSEEHHTNTAVLLKPLLHSSIKHNCYHKNRQNDGKNQVSVWPILSGESVWLHCQHVLFWEIMQITLLISRKIA